MVTANNTYNCCATFKTQSNHSTAASVLCVHVFVPVAVPDGPNPRPTRRYANDVHSPTNKAFCATRACLTVCARDLADQRRLFGYEFAELTVPEYESLKKKTMVVWAACLFLAVVVNLYCCYHDFCCYGALAKLEPSQSAESDTEPDSEGRVDIGANGCDSMVITMRAQENSTMVITISTECVS